MMGNWKKVTAMVLVMVAFFGLGSLAVITGQTLFLKKEVPVAPTVPQVKPHAQTVDTTPACSNSFTVAPPELICNFVTLTPNDTTITTSGETRTLTANATGFGELTYTWTVTSPGGGNIGQLSSNTGQTVTWTAPTLQNASQSWTISATVTDTFGQSTMGPCTVTLNYIYQQIVDAACYQVVADKDLNSLQVGDVVNFTGYGWVSSDTDQIDLIEFTITRDGSVVDTQTVPTVRAPEMDTGDQRYWKATLPYTITNPGTYSVTIRVHWLGADTWKS